MQLKAKTESEGGRASAVLLLQQLLQVLLLRQLLQVLLLRQLVR